MFIPFTNFFQFFLSLLRKSKESEGNLQRLSTCPTASASTHLKMDGWRSYVKSPPPGRPQDTALSSSLLCPILSLLLLPSKIRNKSTFSSPCFLCQLPHDLFVLLRGTIFKNIVCSCFLQFFSSHCNFQFQSGFCSYCSPNYSHQVTDDSHLA